MKKSVIVILSLVCIVVVSCAISKKTASVGYENLKVLPKNTNKHQMDSVMKHFTASLGVRCNYCHVKGNDAQQNWDFASDSNQNKNIARDMMRMTADLNKKYFNIKNSSDLTSRLQVTCFTCHNGKENPGKIPPVQAR